MRELLSPCPKMSYHPLDPLTPSELTQTTTAVRSHILNRQSPHDPIKSVKFAYVTLLEPSKAVILRYLGISTTPDVLAKPEGDAPPREAECGLIDPTTGSIYIFKVLLSSPTTAKVLSEEKLAEGLQIGITNEELIAGQDAVRADPRVIQLCADVGESHRVPPDIFQADSAIRQPGIEALQIVADCWSIGYDERFGPTRRLQAAFVYARLGKDEHLYAHPLDFNVVLDSNTAEILHIGTPPSSL